MKVLLLLGYSHSALGDGHVEVAQHMVGVVTGAVVLVRVSHAHRVLSPGPHSALLRLQRRMRLAVALTRLVRVRRVHRLAAFPATVTDRRSVQLESTSTS